MNKLTGVIGATETLQGSIQDNELAINVTITETGAKGEPADKVIIETWKDLTQYSREVE